MHRWFSIILIGFVLLLCFSGCVGKTGVVRLNTDPPEAQYYLDGVERGTTPGEFECDIERPVLLEIRKDGYHPEEELLNKAWLQYQISKGNYGEIRVGKATYQWTVTINCKLKAAPTIVTPGPSGLESNQSTQ